MYRPNLKRIEESYEDVLKHWQEIDDLLDQTKVGRKDQPFDRPLMDKMLSGWEYLDFIIKKRKHGLFSAHGGPDMLEINHRIHYGSDNALRKEYKKAMEATTEKFSRQVIPIRDYYKKKTAKNEDPYHIAAEVFVSIVGMPQLFIECNHRSGSIIASWINLANGKPPFVLTRENAVSFFAPAQAIKSFNKKNLWRSMTELPKYKHEFKVFWKAHCDKRFARS